MTTDYARNQTYVGPFRVVFMVNATGVKIAKGFENQSAAQAFVRKLKYSKKCTLLSYPIWK